MNPIKILIVDDHPMMREALQTALLGADDLEVIGEASDPIEAFAFLKTLTPDVILMDLMMPKMNGVEAVERILASDPTARILVITSLENEESVLAAIQAGALGYFAKTSPRENLLEAIRKVADGIPYLPDTIAAKLMHGLRQAKSAPKTRDTSITLTERQIEILKLMVEGKSDSEIANILRLQESTIRAHIYHVQQRLGVEGRAQVIAYAHNSFLKR